MKMLFILCHGKESGPDGNKLIALSKIAEGFGFQVLRPDFRHTQIASERIDYLLNLELPAHDFLIIGGSSMGGYVATHTAKKLNAKGVFILAPALGMPEYPIQQEHLDIPISIVHGWDDDVVPFLPVLKWAHQNHAEISLVYDDHRLKNSVKFICDQWSSWYKRKF